MGYFFTEVPTVGKHIKIVFEGYLLTYDRTNPSGINTIGVPKVRNDRQKIDGGELLNELILINYTHKNPLKCMLLKH